MFPRRRESARGLHLLQLNYTSSTADGHIWPAMLVEHAYKRSAYVNGQVTGARGESGAIVDRLARRLRNSNCWLITDGRAGRGTWASEAVTYR